MTTLLISHEPNLGFEFCIGEGIAQCNIDDFSAEGGGTCIYGEVIVDLRFAQNAALDAIRLFREKWGWETGVLALVHRGGIASALCAGADVALEEELSADLVLAALNSLRNLVERTKGREQRNMRPPLPDDERPTPVILIAEDNTMIRKSVEIVLEKWGCIVLAAKNGDEALRLATNFRLDAIVLDMEMPVMNGLQTASAMRDFAQHLTHVPIIGFSSRDKAADRQACIDAGMDSFVSKAGGVGALMKELAPFSPNWVPLP